MIHTGLDRLLADVRSLAGRRYALLAHGASVTGDLVPIHLALAGAGAPPARLLAPEHGFYGVEQDMVPAAGGRDPWTGLPIVSLYGDRPETLVPRPEVFSGLDLLIVDLQDVGCRYYTYAASGVWAIEAALGAGLEAWVLDRPNPLGGETIEGNLPRPGFASFVGAFLLPVRHGLTMGELVTLEARRRGWRDAVRIWTLEGWQRGMSWGQIGRPWIAPSPNMPTPATAWVYPGACLLEATRLSEGRGTTRPFLLAGAPGVDPVALARRLEAARLPGVRFLPTYFRPQSQKHAAEVCGGVELVPTDPRAIAAYRCGVELLCAFREVAAEAFGWREGAYEFVAERPAIDLLTGDDALRRALDRGDDLVPWLAGWVTDEATFRAERESILLYR